MTNAGGELLAEVLKFMRRYDLVDTQFGSMAVNSSQFVFNLRKGRQCRPATVERVRAFMAAGDPRPPGSRSRFARRYAMTVKRNAAAEAHARVFRSTDEVERAKTFLRRDGLNVFDAGVHAESPRQRRALRGKIGVARKTGTQLYDRDEFLDLARRRGWTG